MKRRIVGSMMVALFLLTLIPVAAVAKVDEAQIMDVQRSLKALNYSCDCTGKMDAATLEAIKQFQKDHGMTVDGMCTPETMSAIQKAYDEKSGHAAHE
ncbi:MAG: peptidoglycan-binding domain-containing protein [bacterium]